MSTLWLVLSEHVANTICFWTARLHCFTAGYHCLLLYNYWFHHLTYKILRSTWTKRGTLIKIGNFYGERRTGNIVALTWRIASVTSRPIGGENELTRDTLRVTWAAPEGCCARTCPSECSVSNLASLVFTSLSLSSWDLLSVLQVYADYSRAVWQDPDHWLSPNHLTGSTARGSQNQWEPGAVVTCFCALRGVVMVVSAELSKCSLSLPFRHH